MTDLPDPGSPGYAAALGELETILFRLQDDDLDVDALAGDVRRAVELIGICRSRLDVARLEVERVVAELEPPET